MEPSSAVSGAGRSSSSSSWSRASDPDDNLHATAANAQPPGGGRGYPYYPPPHLAHTSPYPPFDYHAHYGGYASPNSHSVYASWPAPPPHLPPHMHGPPNGPPFPPYNSPHGGRGRGRYGGGRSRLAAGGLQDAQAAAVAAAEAAGRAGDDSDSSDGVAAERRAELALAAATAVSHNERTDETEDQLAIEARNLRTVFVHGIHPYTTDAQIRDFFSKAGEVRQVDRVQDGKGRWCGQLFVEFYKLQAVAAALALQGSELGGHPVYVEQSVPKLSEAQVQKSHRAGPGGGRGRESHGPPGGRGGGAVSAVDRGSEFVILAHLEASQGDVFAAASAVGPMVTMKQLSHNSWRVQYTNATSATTAASRLLEASIVKDAKASVIHPPGVVFTKEAAATAALASAAAAAAKAAAAAAASSAKSPQSSSAGGSLSLSGSAPPPPSSRASLSGPPSHPMGSPSTASPHSASAPFHGGAPSGAPPAGCSSDALASYEPPPGGFPPPQPGVLLTNLFDPDEFAKQVAADATYAADLVLDLELATSVTAGLMTAAEAENADVAVGCKAYLHAGFGAASVILPTISAAERAAASLRSTPFLGRKIEADAAKCVFVKGLRT